MSVGFVLANSRPIVDDKGNLSPIKGAPTRHRVRALRSQISPQAAPLKTTGRPLPSNVMKPLPLITIPSPAALSANLGGPLSSTTTTTGAQTMTMGGGGVPPTRSHSAGGHGPASRRGTLVIPVPQQQQQQQQQQPQFIQPPVFYQQSQAVPQYYVQQPSPGGISLQQTQPQPQQVVPQMQQQQQPYHLQHHPGGTVSYISNLNHSPVQLQQQQQQQQQQRQIVEHPAVQEIPIQQQQEVQPYNYQQGQQQQQLVLPNPQQQQHITEFQRNPNGTFDIDGHQYIPSPAIGDAGVALMQNYPHLHPAYYPYLQPYMIIPASFYSKTAESHDKQADHKYVPVIKGGYFGPLDGSGPITKPITTSYFNQSTERKSSSDPPQRDDHANHRENSLLPADNREVGNLDPLRPATPPSPADPNMPHHPSHSWHPTHQPHVPHVPHFPQIEDNPNTRPQKSPHNRR